ncbi:Nucleoid-associated protein YgaU, contains BON and LysM domains [Tropicibacter naphthalenivorans]|uniref:LysM domain/BON superfamily protein n=2 Tax=Tropicibacter naphthalenivorans TaxID=441103 RepID=A0A0P1GEA7_9RHOB|nr:LysM domain/BON superfamily protein [Tropicibacter naphthalenivorans]SMC83574.1 Nucleoid-associated protein YgaU, contains BON and LysM domains [Tropicibacter naphthalenivorans]
MISSLAVAGTAGVVALAVAQGWITLGTDGAPLADAPKAPEPAPLVAAAPAPQVAPEVTPVPAPPAVAPVLDAPLDMDAGPADPETAPEVAVPPDVAEDAAPEVPSFDIVRAEADGNTLVAGQGAPGAVLEVIVNGAAVAETVVDSAGQFVAFVDLSDQTDGASVTLRATQDGAEVLSDSEVLIAPMPAPEPDQLAALSPVETPDMVLESAPAAPPPPEAALQGAEEGAAAPMPEVTAEAALPEADEVAVAPAPLPEVTAEAPEAPAAVAPTGAAGVATSDDPQILARAEPAAAQAPASAAAPTVLLNGPDGIEVLQTAPLAPGEVALDSISYDARGEVLLSGRGGEAGFVRVYLDNRPVTTSRIRDDGRWRLELPQVDTGTYTLRVDQIDEAGQVVARVESPFLRESAEVLEAAQIDGPITSITVQPGHTLWGISRDRYGDGLDYVRVFNANRDRIRDPDLIYPGQIFDLPERGE